MIPILYSIYIGAKRIRLAWYRHNRHFEWISLNLQLEIGVFRAILGLLALLTAQIVDHSAVQKQIITNNIARAKEDR